MDDLPALPDPSEVRRFATVTPCGPDARDRAIACETPVAISVCGFGYAVMMATPADLDDFAWGFALSERLIDRAAQVERVALRREERGILLDIWLADECRERVVERVRHRVGESSCGLCGVENLDQALRPLPTVAAPADIPPGACPVRKPWPINLSNALCRPTSSRVARMVPWRSANAAA